MDLFKIGNELSYIGQLLETIRNLSKNEATDFRHAPYDDDVYLLHYLLDEKIGILLDSKRNG